MIDDVKSRYAIDEERIYACGQSSGGMMTSELALRAPQVFAAVSPWSALKSPDREVPLPERIDPSVPYLFLLWIKNMENRSIMSDTILRHSLQT